VPTFPPAALDDVEAARQRASSEAQNAFLQNMQFVAQAGQRSLDQANFVANQAQLGFLGLQSALGLGGQLNNSILDARSTRDQPQVSPMIAFVPSPATAQNPVVAPTPVTPKSTTTTS
jgi:hypothetical protein